MENIVPDALVLKIVEHDTDVNMEDTTLYILYDTTLNKYIIRGKRKDTRHIVSNPYSFECDNAKNLVEFVEFLMDDHNEFSFVLYNYNNLPESSNDIDFDFLNQCAINANEMTGYDNRKLNRTDLFKMFRILRNVNNYY